MTVSFLYAVMIRYLTQKMKGVALNDSFSGIQEYSCNEHPFADISDGAVKRIGIES